MLKLKNKKNNLILPDTDCISISIVHKGKLYGGFVKVKWSHDSVNKALRFLSKSAINTISKLQRGE